MGGDRVHRRFWGTIPQAGALVVALLLTLAAPPPSPPGASGGGAGPYRLVDDPEAARAHPRTGPAVLAKVAAAEGPRSIRGLA